MSTTDDAAFESLYTEARSGKDIFNIPLINERIQNRPPDNSIQAVRDELLSFAHEVKQSNVPMLTPDEIIQQYTSIMDSGVTIWDDTTTSDQVEKTTFIQNRGIFHHKELYDAFGENLKKHLHAAPVTHTRSQRNFLQDYTHLRSPLRRYLLSHSVHNLNEAIVDFAERGGFSCFNRCMKDPGRPINADERRCVHFCGETLADVRKILVTDWLNSSENLDGGHRVPSLPAGNEMGDKETGTFNSSNRHSRFNQYQRQWGGVAASWLNQDT